MSEEKDIVEVVADDAGPGPLSLLCDREWQDLLDKDDRTSPADYPDMVLIARNEFGGIMSEAYLLAKDQAASEILRLRGEVERLHQGLRVRGMRIDSQPAVDDALAAIDEWKGNADRWGGEVERLTALASREGWVMVPREPIEAMIDNAVGTLTILNGSEWELARQFYAAMLSSAPKPEEG